MSQYTDRLSPESFRESHKATVRVVLENIRSGLNVGAFFRTADALRIDGIDLCGYTAHPPQRDILKSALGASEHVQWTPHETTEHALEALRRDGYNIAAIEQTPESLSLTEWNPAPGTKWALVFGNEVRGVAPETVAASDLALEIPQFGVKQSLNVSVCGGIVLWEAVRKLGFPS